MLLGGKWEKVERGMTWHGGGEGHEHRREFKIAGMGLDECRRIANGRLVGHFTGKYKKKSVVDAPLHSERKKRNMFDGGSSIQRAGVLPRHIKQN